MNKFSFALIIIACISSCSTIKTEPLKAVINFQLSQPTNDLQKDNLPTHKISTLVSDKGKTIVPFQPSYAVVCNEAKTTCKHAAILVSVSTEVEEINGKKYATGTVNWTYGRRIEYRDNVTVLVKSVPNEIDVILEGEQQQQFRVASGDTLILPKLFGSELQISF